MSKIIPNEYSSELTRKKTKLISFLKDPDIQSAFDAVLKKHFPRFNATASADRDQVLMRLLHRDAADSFIDHLYESAALPKPRKTLTPKQLIRE